MKIDYDKKYQRKDNPQWTAERLVLENNGKIWYTIENGDSMFSSEEAFIENYRLFNDSETEL